MDPGRIQSRVGLEDVSGSGPVFFGDGVDGFPGLDGVRLGGLGMGRPQQEKGKQPTKAKQRHGNKISPAGRAACG